MGKSGENRISNTLHVENLSKTYGEGEDSVTAVEDISFDVESGEVVGLLGPNGAGKTTMIKSMLGLVIPDTGTVEVAGVNVRENPGKAYSHVGAMLEGARNIYWRLTVQENLSFFAGIGGDHPKELRERHERLLEQLDLADRADTAVNELSRGMKQKVSLASTLSRDVEAVFLDEPTLGLDIETSLELRSELRRLADNEDVTILISSHDMDVIEEICDRVLILSDGSIIANDEVEALLDLFQTQQYRITVSEPIEEPLERTLVESYDADIWAEGDRWNVEFLVEESDTVYEVMELFSKENKSLLDIKSVERDLEEVFLRLTDDDNSPGEIQSDRVERQTTEETDSVSVKQ